MGECYDQLHIQCVIMGEILLGTLDRIREELIHSGELRLYQAATIETGRRQVVEYLITLYYRQKAEETSTNNVVRVKQELIDPSPDWQPGCNQDNRKLIVKTPGRKRYRPSATISKAAKGTPYPTLEPLPKLQKITVPNCVESLNQNDSENRNDPPSLERNDVSDVENEEAVDDNVEDDFSDNVNDSFTENVSDSANVNDSTNVDEDNVTENANDSLNLYENDDDGDDDANVADSANYKVRIDHTYDETAQDTVRIVPGSDSSDVEDSLEPTPLKLTAKNVKSALQNPQKAARFRRLEDEELNEMEDCHIEKTTKMQTKWAVNLFRGWLIERQESTDFENLDEVVLAGLLRRFYGEINTKDGKPYSRSAMTGLRAGINRYLQAPPFNKTFNIVTQKEFTAANKVMAGRVRKNRAAGLNVVRHKPAIAEADIRRLYSSGTLSLRNPTSLQHKVFFELVLHFGPKGREGLCGLKKSDIIFVREPTVNPSLEYATINLTETSTKKSQESKDQRMYSRPNDPACPVASLKLYLSKLSPEEENFFQVPKKFQSSSMDYAVCFKDKDVWYSKKLGINSILNMMKTISKLAGLAQIYSNYSICATNTTVLPRTNILPITVLPRNDIIKLTGNKDATCLILPYVSPSPAITTVTSKDNMSGVLQDFGKCIVANSVSSSAVRNDSAGPIQLKKILPKVSK